jgi:hypothetical protein
MGCGCQNQDDQLDDFCPDAEVTDQVAEVTTKQSIGRRTLLKAAGVGATVAALAGRQSANPFASLAASPCTAGDIEVSNGVISNEPCTCSGNFDAIASFQVRNDNNSTRKCITLILGPGGTFGGRSFLLTTDPSGIPSGTNSNISGHGTTQTMYAHLGTLSCNFTSECYADSVVAFQTAQNSQDTACSGPLTRFPGGQCRRQTICITGFGIDVFCANSDCTSSGSTGPCTVACGGTLRIFAQATGASAGATGGTYTYKLFAGPDTTGTLIDTKSGATACFSVANPDPNVGTYTVAAYDSLGCFRAKSINVSVTQITGGITHDTPGCNGQVVFSATPTGSGCTYVWKVDGTTQSETGANFTYSPTVDGANHTVSVQATCGGCTAPAVSQPVNSCVTTTFPS